MMQSRIDKIQRGQFDVIWWNWLNKSFDRVIGRMGIIRVLKRIHRDKNRNRKGKKIGDFFQERTTQDEICK